jgi:pimeloyl-ACP methyl ester carboxylesterase
VALLAAALMSAGPAPAATQPAGCAAQLAAADRYLCGKLDDGAIYTIEVPPHWNGALFLYSHGYVTPGSALAAADVGDPVTGGWLLSHGYALAGSSYATTGWAIQQALPDQISTLNVFDRQVGAPAQTIAWGHSLGGIITAGLIQDYPGRFSAALPMCGVLAGGPGWPWPPRSVTSQAGSPRCRPSPPPTTSRRRRATSTCGTPRWTSRSASPCEPSLRRAPAATRPGTPG